MKTKKTHQVSSVLYRGGGCLRHHSFFPAPSITIPLVQIRSIAGTDKCDEDDGESYTSPPLNFVGGGGGADYLPIVINSRLTTLMFMSRHHPPPLSNPMTSEARKGRVGL